MAKNDGITSSTFKNGICPTPNANSSDWGGLSPKQDDEPARASGELGPGVGMANSVPGAPSVGESLRKVKVPGS